MNNYIVHCINLNIFIWTNLLNINNIINTFPHIRTLLLLLFFIIIPW